eukprot:CAMPEP_0113948168 /NCGR_PEP_ID=MMETSP1339-20121228/68882_1 /TAXON_ID=94617 /ORGANISM="Fibrocapsa japonica" /LENGTH=1055 /DNA_ID=CAMNT_0000955109 /DNA_START=417 /DNA_END=3580 /DNA_ORIENTATION=+ /assembly_acc=CAM_ASM_000762
MTKSTSSDTKMEASISPEVGSIKPRDLSRAVVRTVENDQIVKPQGDKRQYRHIWLENGLQVLLTSDPSIDVAAASMHIHCGHFHDPEEFPGLAHFHEHMLFLGTQAFPQEGEYERFLSEHGGYTNAYTSMEDTNYYFAVEHMALRPALQRFSAFFLSPLFDEGALDREQRAVDSEHTNNVLEDNWRITQVAKSTSDRRHPFHKFSTGNLQTLAKPGVRDALLDFNQRYYSAPLMKLTLVGREGLEDLQNMAVEYFQDVRNSGTPPNHVYPTPAFGPDQLGTLRHTVALKERRSVSLMFALPKTDGPQAGGGLWSKPCSYLSHLIGHEGPGSLHLLLNSRGWINSLSAGVPMKFSDAEYFKVSISLTEEGAKHIDEINLLVFAYINLLRKEGPQEWIHNEIAQMSAVSFRYKEWGEAVDFAQDTAQLMKKYPPEYIMSGPYRMSEWDPDLVEKITGLLTPENCVVEVVNKDFGLEPDIDEWEQEEWYGTRFRQARLSEAQVAAWREAQAPAALALPPPNRFLPTDFTIRAIAAATKQGQGQGEEEGATASAGVEGDGDGDDAAVLDMAGMSPSAVAALAALDTTPPTLVHEEEGYKIWHKMDSTFLVPKSNILVKLFTGEDGNYASPVHMTMVRLYARMVREELNEFSYDARMAGLRYGISADPDSLDISVSGYSDKLPELLQRVATTTRSILSDLRSMGHSPEGLDGEVKKLKRWAAFEKHRQGLLREYNNFVRQSPYEVASYYTRHALESKMYHLNEYAAVLRSTQLCTPAGIARVLEGVLSRLQVEVLAHGNLDSEEATHLSSLLKAELQSIPLPTSELPDDRLVVVPQKGVLVQMPTPNEDEENSAVEVHFQVGPEDGEDDSGRRGCLLDLVSHMAYTSAFNQLRTEEQLGYIVSSFQRKSGEPQVLGFSVMVQGPHHPPSHLDDRIENWLQMFRQQLVDMSPEEFSSNVNAVVLQKLEKDTRLNEETGRHWAEISTRKYNFERWPKEARVTSALTQAQLVAFVDRHFTLGSPDRRKLAVHIASAKLPADQLAALPAHGAGHVLHTLDDIRA